MICPWDAVHFLSVQNHLGAQDHNRSPVQVDNIFRFSHTAWSRQGGPCSSERTLMPLSDAKVSGPESRVDLPPTRVTSDAFGALRAREKVISIEIYGYCV